MPAKRDGIAPSSINIIDCNFGFHLVEWVRQATSATHADDHPITLSYNELSSILADHRTHADMRPAQASLAMVSIDPNNRSQQKFPDALERFGYVVERLDYRHTWVTEPQLSQGDRPDRQQVSSMAPSQAYVLGLIAAQTAVTGTKPDVVLVTGGFDLFNPLQHFVKRTGGRVVLSFFRRFLDPRWGMNGLFDPTSPITFFDLEPFSGRLLGVDISKLTDSKPLGTKGGLERLF